MILVLCALIGYLLGSFSTGIVVARLYGKVDIRKEGSGNVGMTNVMRTLGWVPSFLTFAGDALKSILGALIGKWLGGDIGLQIGGLFAVIGHNWPVYYGFKGGKGMSSSFGFLLVADWRIALILLILQAIVVLVTGYMSVASLITAVLLPVLAILLDWKYWSFIAAAFCLCIMAIYSHRTNIIRLANGQENKLSLNKINETSRKMVQKIKDRRKNK